MLTPPSPASMQSCASTMSPSSAANTPTGISGAVAAAAAVALAHSPSPVSMITGASDGSARSDSAECSAEDDGNSTMVAVVEPVPSPPPPRAATKRRVDALLIDPAEHEGGAKRAMLGVRPSTFARTLYHAASSAALVGEIAPVLPVDPRCFAEPTAFAKKHVPTHSTPTMRAQPADANRLYCAPLQAHAFAASAASSFAHSTAALSIAAAASCSDVSPSSASAPSLHLGGVSLVPFSGGSSVFAPLAMPPARPAGAKRFKLQCPPTPMPAMCIAAGDSSRELFCNKLLRRRGVPVQADGSDMSDPSEPVAPLDDDDSSVDDGCVDGEGVGSESAADSVDVHASPSFGALRTYASSPFAHSRGEGPFLFERDFRAHKTVGCGGFFEVFRVEAARPQPQPQRSHQTPTQRQLQQQREFEQFSLDLDTQSARAAASAAVGPSSAAIVPPVPTASATAGTAPVVARAPRRRVYAIKKSLRAFRSASDRACLLRETVILALLGETRLSPPPRLLARAARGAAVSVPLRAHRNPHLIRWHQTWQEAGFFFQQIEYATCTLAELVFVLMETPPDGTTSAMATSTTPALSPHAPDTASDSNAAAAAAVACYPDPSLPVADPPLSFFHQHLPRLFLSIVAQLSLALHTLHCVAGGGIVHLDLKPDNLLLNRRGTRLLLSDFGFSRRLAELQPQGSGSGAGAEPGSATGRSQSGSRSQSPHSASRRCASDELEGDSVYMALELLGNGPTDDDDEADSDADSSDDEGGSGENSKPKSRAANGGRGGGGGGGVATPACDMFSLGLLLFELVTNSELPKSGYLWQRLRQGFVRDYLPVFPDEEEEDEEEGEGQGEDEPRGRWPSVGAEGGPHHPALGRAPAAVTSQSHLGAGVRSDEAHQCGITAWMVGVIANLMEPVPSARMSAAELLVAVEEKLLALGWIDPPAAEIDEEETEVSVEARAHELAFVWTTVLPPCLALPPLASLNFNALLERAREMNMPPATPTTASPGTAAQSPAPHFTFAEAAAAAAAASSSLSRGPSPQPGLMRQRSSPSPSRSGGFFCHKLQPRISPVPFAHTAAGGLPQSPWSLDSARASITPLRMQRRLPAHVRSSSTGNFLLSGDPAGLPRAPTPTYATMTASCVTPSLRRPRSSLPVSQSPSSANDAATPAPRVRSTQPLPSVCRPSEQPWDASPPKPRLAASGSFTKNTAAPIPRPIIIPPQQSAFSVRRATFQPLSPFRLNSPARKHTEGAGAGAAPSAPVSTGGARVAPLAVLSPDLPRMSSSAAIAERDAALPLHPVALAAVAGSASAMSVQMSLLSSSVATASSGGATMATMSAGSGSSGMGAGAGSGSGSVSHYRALFTSSTQSIVAPSPALRGFSSGIFGALSTASAVSPPALPLFALGSASSAAAATTSPATLPPAAVSVSVAASRGASMFGGGGSRAAGGVSMFGGLSRSPPLVRAAAAPLPLLHVQCLGEHPLPHPHFAALLPSPVDMPGPALAGEPLWPGAPSAGSSAFVSPSG